MAMLTRKVAGRIYNYEFCFTGGQGGGAFGNGTDFALGPNNTVYFVSRGNEFTPSYGMTKCTIDVEQTGQNNIWNDRGIGFADSKSLWPTCITLDSQEKVYFTDENANLVLIYDKDGNYLDSWGTQGSGDGELNSPSGIEIDQDDNLYVVDTMNHRIQKFTRDGKFLAKWGSFGAGDGQLNMPFGIAIDKDGYIYVADWKNDRVQKFTAEGQYLMSFGSSGSGDGELSRPTSVAVDNQGDVYVTDYNNDRVNVYDDFGDFITAFTGDADQLPPTGRMQVAANPDYVKARRRVDLTQEKYFRRPVAVNIDAEGRILVLDQQRNRMQVYVKEQNWIDAQFNL